MKFNDEGIIISLKNYSENSIIVKVFSRNHGVYKGFVKSIKSSKAKTLYQIGNLISFEYRSRLEDNLGSFFSVDLHRSYCSKIMFEKLKLDCVSSMFSIIDACFLEREKEENLFENLNGFLVNISSSDSKPQNFLREYVRLELQILGVLGYGVDLSSCVATESTQNLSFVSPKSARAVSFEAGLPYKDKLLKLPKFLIEDNDNFCESEIFDGLNLSGYFLKKHIFADNNEKNSSRSNLEEATFNLKKK